jgi:dihydroorotate dehydrogenase (NAD+) catalytic subunit
MAAERLTARLGATELRSPLIAASGTVGSVWEWAEVADVSRFGAAVAKSVAPEPWPGRLPPRVAPLPVGMLNGIGIQNPGIAAWVVEVGPRIAASRVPVWGSAVAGDPAGFATVAKELELAGVAAIEVNLSCPNLDDGAMFSFDPSRSEEVVAEVAAVTGIPIGAKLSPNTPDVVEVAAACHRAGADFLVLTNTALGLGIDLGTRRPLVSGGVGGYSGPGLKPLALRCVHEVAQALPGVPIVGCGGVASGEDVAEYLLAGASAVELGTVLLAEPTAGRRIARELADVMGRMGVEAVGDLTGAMEPW